MRASHLLTLVSSALLMGCATDPLVLHTRSRELVARSESVLEETVRWAPSSTAIVVCDMWDDHWCAGAAARVAELAGPMNELLATARDRGVFIVHAPSSVTSFYDGTPQRQRALDAPHADTPVPLSSDERWGTNWCWPDPSRESELPIDDSDMGCDCEPECELREAWTRQIATLELHPDDALTDSGQEAWNLFQERGIKHVLLVGVHLNMCVLGRPFAIRQMVHLGKDVLLVRDMTDSMYDSDMSPYVTHFEGTELVVEHVERHWCASILSSDLTGAESFHFRR